MECRKPRGCVAATGDSLWMLIEGQILRCRAEHIMVTNHNPKALVLYVIKNEDSRRDRIELGFRDRASCEEFLQHTPPQKNVVKSKPNDGGKPLPPVLQSPVARINGRAAVQNQTLGRGECEGKNRLVAEDILLLRAARNWRASRYPR